MKVTLEYKDNEHQAPIVEILTKLSVLKDGSVTISNNEGRTVYSRDVDLVFNLECRRIKWNVIQ